MRGKLSRAVIILLSVVLIIGAVAYFLQKNMVRLFEEDVMVPTSAMEEIYECEFLVMREEKVVTAPFKGEYVRLRQEGERVANQTIVCSLTKREGTALEKETTIAITAPQAGVVSFLIDGLEGVFHSQTWAEIDISKLDELKKKLVFKSYESADKSSLQAGDPLFKIIDNLEPCYLYVKIPQPNGSEIKKGQQLKLRINESPEEIVTLQSRVIDVCQHEEEIALFLKVSCLASFNQCRLIKGLIMLNGA